MNRISPRYLFIAGLLALPPFLFQQQLPIKAVQALSFILLCVVFKRKMLLLPPLIAFLSITFINILTPHGEIIYTLGPFHLTSLALFTGLKRALTLIGLVYLSKLTITRMTPLPGTLGTLIAETFYYFERMMELWRTVRQKRLLVKLDTLLIMLEEEPAESREDDHPPSRSYSLPVSILFLILFAGANWALLLRI